MFLNYSNLFSNDSSNVSLYVLPLDIPHPLPDCSNLFSNDSNNASLYVSLLDIPHPLPDKLNTLTI